MSTTSTLQRSNKRRRRSFYCSNFLIGVATALWVLPPPGVDFFAVAFLLGGPSSLQEHHQQQNHRYYKYYNNHCGAHHGTTGKIQCGVGSSSTQLGVRHGPRNNKNGGPVKTNNNRNKSSASNNNSYGKNKSTKKDKLSSTSKKTQSLQSPPDQQQQQQQAPKKKKSVPPWQVLNTQEAKRNLEFEKDRRAAIQAGTLPTDATLNDLQNMPHNQPKTLSKAFLDPATSKFLNWRRFNPVTQPAGLRFVGAYLDDAQLPPRRGVPEIAFLGRSNVGKSSLLNCLSQSALRRGSGGQQQHQQQQQARVGQTPGATASVNLYVLQDARERDLLVWVDLPGFGYAQLSKVTQERIQAAAERYLNHRRHHELALGILLVDVRRTPSDDDRAVLAALYDRRVPILVVATKLDKLKGGAHVRERQLQIIRDGLGLPDQQPLAVSSVTNEGCRELWHILTEACEQRVTECKSRYDATAAAELFADDDEEEDEHGFAESEDADGYVYNQGYDWIHGNPILYENEDSYIEEAGSDRQFFLDEDEDTLGVTDDLEGSLPARRETLKTLKKKARDMERRGEV